MKKFEGLSPIYKAIRRGIQELAGIDEVDWFNSYDDMQLHDQGCFVEFPEDVVFEDVSKNLSRASLRIRLHVYTKVLRDADGYIALPATEAHDQLALTVRNEIKHKMLLVADGDFFTGHFDDADFYVEDEAPEQLTERLKFAVWRHYHHYKGFMITWLEFTTRVEG